MLCFCSVLNLRFAWVSVNSLFVDEIVMWHLPVRNIPFHKSFRNWRTAREYTLTAFRTEPFLTQIVL